MVVEETLPLMAPGRRWVWEERGRDPTPPLQSTGSVSSLPFPPNRAKAGASSDLCTLVQSRVAMSAPSKVTTGSLKVSYLLLTFTCLGHFPTLTFLQETHFCVALWGCHPSSSPSPVPCHFFPFHNPQRTMSADSGSRFPPFPWCTSSPGYLSSLWTPTSNFTWN